MKKIYISCDMEGITGICHNRHRNMGDHDYAWARKMMTDELNVVIELLLQRGVEEILVNDSHNNMLNLHIDDLNPAVLLLSGGQKTDSMMEGLNSDFDGAMLIGYHARSGIRRGVLSHTYADSIVTVEINGVSAGESYLNTAFCGARDVPMLIVSGDDLLAEEVSQFNTGTQSVIVKKGVSRSAGIMFHPDKVKEAYAKAVEKVFSSKVNPLKIEGPYQLTISLRETQMMEIAMRIPGAKAVNDNTLSFEFDDYITAYRTFILVQSIASGNYLK